jgi:hypothetical protein
MSADITPQPTQKIEPEFALETVCVEVTMWLKESEQAPLSAITTAFKEQFTDMPADVRRIVWARSMRLYMEAA